jgi:hypothetical protein
MRTTMSQAAVGILLAALSACAPARVSTMSGGDVDPTMEPSTTAADASRVVANWPMMPRDAANMLITRYGRPDVAGDRMLVWYNKGPYVRIAITRDEQPHNFPMPHTDFLTSAVKYAVPLDRLDELARYDGSVWFHRTRGELMAQCDKEELNNLALNLAHDVATGKRTVDDARAFYAKTAMDFKQGNRSSPYVTGLIFTTQPASADADAAHRM